jgi:diacylglycerol kinase (ATP)
VPGADMTDGLLDVIAAERLSLVRVGLALLDRSIGRHRPVHRVHALRAESLTVSSVGRQEIALDGEVIGELPVEFTVVPAAVRVVVPREDAVG